MAKGNNQLNLPEAGLPVRRDGGLNRGVPAPMLDVPAYGSYGYGVQQDEPDMGGALLLYWNVLRRGKWTLVVAAILGVIIGVAVTLPQAKRYDAATTLEIQPLNEDFLNMRQMSPVQQATPYEATQGGDIATQVKILSSSTLVERVVSRFLPSQRPKWQPGMAMPKPPSLVDSVKRAFEPSKKTPKEKALDMAIDHMKVQAAPDTRIVEVTTDSTDPVLAAEFVNALAEEYIKQNIEVRWNMTKRTGEWLSKEIDDLRLKLEHSEEALQNYARSAGLVITTETGGKMSEEQLRSLQTELNKAQGDRAQTQSRFEMARNSQPEELAELLQSDTLRVYQTRLTELRQQLADASSTYTPAHAKVQKIQAQINEVEAALKRERQAVLSRVRTDFEAAQRREKLLQADYARQTAKVTDDAQRSVQYNILKREVDSNRQLYEMMLRQMKEASIASALRASNVRVVDAAAPSPLPSKPKLSINAGAGLMLGFLFGCVFLIARERYDRTVQTPEDVTLYTGLSGLGVIPSAQAGTSKRFYYRRPKAELSSPEQADGESGRREKLELVTQTRRGSVLAESFRTTLTSILFSGQHGIRPRVIVLTSASPGEGKTTVSSNLSVALAEAGQRVLLIDGDMRRPRLHTIYDLENSAGLADVLQERETPIADLLKRVVHESGVPNLWVLPSGPSSLNATNLLYSPQLNELVAQARKDYDMVIIDTPPILNIADARVLGQASDAVVLVVRARKTSRDLLKSACQRFAEDGTRILGIILNDWDPTASASGSYGYSSYYHGYHNYYHAPREGDE